MRGGIALGRGACRIAQAIRVAQAAPDDVANDTKFSPGVATARVAKRVLRMTLRLVRGATRDVRGGARTNSGVKDGTRASETRSRAQAVRA